MRAIAFIGAAVAAVSYLYLRYFRRWHKRWGATDAETRERLPGDDLVPAPKLESTRAVTIDAPPKDVWPWLVQLGYGRAGFYSYDILENLFTRMVGMKAHYRSLNEIVPELQKLREGDFIASAPLDWQGGKFAEKMGWTVKRLEAPRLMALENWGAFVLEPLENGKTRLIARTRAGQTWKDALLYLPWDLPHFVMERGMLLGIKKRAERLAREKREEQKVAQGVAP
jgi:hypothetical protein